MKKFSKELLTDIPIDDYWKNILGKINFAEVSIPYSTMQDIINYLSNPENVRNDYTKISENKTYRRFFTGYRFEHFIKVFNRSIFHALGNALEKYEEENS